MYGLTVRSEVQLPLPHVSLAGDAELTIELVDEALRAPSADPHTEAYCSEPCHAGGAYSRMWRQPVGAWIWHDAVGILHVSTDARRVRVYPTASWTLVHSAWSCSVRPPAHASTSWASRACTRVP